jgi:hypothetical protein
VISMPQDKRVDGRGLDQEFYVRISNSAAFRKNLLETSKGTIGILREMYAVKQIRDKKHEKTEILHNELKELKMLVQKLEEMMPGYTKADIKKHFPDFVLEKKIKEQPKEAPDRKVIEKKITAPKPSSGSELDKLSAALGDIQKKLGSL